jgi:RNA-directed DNA polymerase
LNWKKIETKVKSLQEEIVIARVNEDFKELYRLQWLLIQSLEARALAVRKVITNKGGKTAGVDDEVWKSGEDYWNAIQKLGEIIQKPSEYQAKPLRRVYIPKGNTGEMRPLGIPTILDRAMQAVYHFAVDPVVEAQSDPNSYGFRKNRSTHDAITAIRSLLDKKTHSKWILEVDIVKCFDQISHEFLMKNTSIIHKNVLEQWLKAGVMEEMNYFDTTEGTPQGGIISPVLCNIALNGLESEVKKAFPLKKGISPGVHLIRYADDMIITGRTEEMLTRAQKIVTDFLKIRGLKLNEKNTKKTNIKEGFDFLGFNVRRMQRTWKFNSEDEQETVLIIKPSEKGIKKFKDSVRRITQRNKPFMSIIKEINPIIRGWVEHKRISYHSQATFIKLDHWIYMKMMYWIKKQNPGAYIKILNKHLVATSSRRWNWGLTAQRTIVNMAETAIIALRPLKLDKNPYLSTDFDYFHKRKERIIESKFRAVIIKKYNHKCPHCEETLNNGEPIEFHHIIPKSSGGKYTIENIQPLHRVCHAQITYRFNQQRQKGKS